MAGHGFDNQSAILPDVCDSNVEILDLRFVPDTLIKQWYFYSSAERLVILIFYPILLTFGFIGNFTFLLVVVKIHSMRTITNVYLANLAVADILFMLTSTYNILYGYLISPTIKTWPFFTSAGCMTIIGGIYLSLFSSIFLILLVSIERYLAICKPIKHRLLVSKGRTTKLVVLAWIAGMLCTLPIAPHYGKLQQNCVLWPDLDEYSNAPMLLGSCVPAHSFYAYIPLLIQPLPFVVASIIISLMYYNIVKTLHVRSRGDLVAESPGNFDRNAQQARNKVAGLLIITAAVFFLCTLPYYVTEMNAGILIMTDKRVGYKLNAVQQGIVLQVVRGLGVVNSIINPVIYSVTNPRYRRAFIAVFTCGFRDENPAGGQ